MHSRMRRVDGACGRREAKAKKEERGGVGGEIGRTVRTPPHSFLADHIPEARDASPSPSFLLHQGPRPPPGVGGGKTPTLGASPDRSPCPQAPCLLLCLPPRPFLCRCLRPFLLLLPGVPRPSPFSGYPKPSSPTPGPYGHEQARQRRPRRNSSLGPPYALSSSVVLPSPPHKLRVGEAKTTARSGAGRGGGRGCWVVRNGCRQWRLVDGGKEKRRGRAITGVRQGTAAGETRGRMGGRGGREGGREGGEPRNGPTRLFLPGQVPVGRGASPLQLLHLHLLLFLLYDALFPSCFLGRG